MGVHPTAFSGAPACAGTGGAVQPGTPLRCFRLCASAKQNTLGAAPATASSRTHINAATGSVNRALQTVPSISNQHAHQSACRAGNALRWLASPASWQQHAQRGRRAVSPLCVMAVPRPASLEGAAPSAEPQVSAIAAPVSAGAAGLAPRDLRLLWDSVDRPLLRVGRAGTKLATSDRIAAADLSRGPSCDIPRRRAILCCSCCIFTALACSSAPSSCSGAGVHNKL